MTFLLRKTPPTSLECHFLRGQGKRHLSHDHDYQSLLRGMTLIDTKLITRHSKTDHRAKYRKEIEHIEVSLAEKFPSRFDGSVQL